MNSFNNLSNFIVVFSINRSKQSFGFFEKV